MPFQVALLMGKNKLIEIGADVNTGAAKKIIDYYFGDAWGLFSMTSYGKTRLIENLLCQMKDRRIIIFDSRGEHKSLKTANPMNINGRGNAVDDLVYIDEFGFKLQDMTGTYDWIKLGFNASGARVCAGIAKQVGYHQNDMERFLDLVDEIQTSKSKNLEFYMTKQSIKSKLKNISSVFVDDHAVEITNTAPERIRYTGNPFYIKDWKKFLTAHRHVCFNFNSEYNPVKAQFFAGKILNEMDFWLKEASVILLEEAHNLFPRNYDDVIPYSAEKIYRYLKGKHKDMVKIIFITQHPQQLSETGFDEIKYYFIGKLENVEGMSRLGEMFRKSSILEFNPSTNYREWICYSPAYNQKFLFVPFDSYTFYQARK